MLSLLREETERKLQMRVSPRNNGLTSLFEEVRVFKGHDLPSPKDTSEFCASMRAGEVTFKTPAEIPEPSSSH